MIQSLILGGCPVTPMLVYRYQKPKGFISIVSSVEPGSISQGDPGTKNNPVSSHVRHPPSRG